jgi:hypothetical protein
MRGAEPPRLDVPDRSPSASHGRVRGLFGWSAAVLFVLIVLRIPVFLDPSEPDSMAFAYGGWVIAEGGAPYVDFVDNKPPGIYLLNALVLMVLPHARESILVFETLWILATTGVVFLVARRLTGSRAARWATLLFAFTLNLQYLTGSGNLTETWALLPVSFAYLAFFSASGGGIPKSGLLFLTGALFAFAMQFRPTAGLPLLPLSGAVIVLPSSGSSPADRFRSLGWMWAGAGTVVVAVAAVLAAWGALGSFGEFALLGNLHYVGAVNSYPVHRIFKALGYAGPVLVFAMLSLPGSLRSADPAVRVLGLCFLADLAGALLSRHWYGHYFIQPLVPAVILAVLFLRDIHAAPGEPGVNRARSLGKQKVKSFLAAVLFLVLLGVALNKEIRYVAGLPERWDARGDIRLLNEMSRYVSATTDAQDLILCHGFGRITNLYLLSGRMAPTRFFHTHYLDRRKFGAAPWMDEAGREYVRDFRERRPALVVMDSAGGIILPGPSAGEFQNLLETGYRHDRDIGDFRILRRRSEVEREANG